MNTARAMAQAKVNLSLRILAREESGFHQIETVFQRLPPARRGGGGGAAAGLRGAPATAA